MKWHIVADGDLPVPDDRKVRLLYIHSPKLRDGHQDGYAVGLYYTERFAPYGPGWLIEVPPAKAIEATVIRWAEIEEASE